MDKTRSKSRRIFFLITGLETICRLLECNEEKCISFSPAKPHKLESYSYNFALDLF